MELAAAPGLASDWRQPTLRGPFHIRVPEFITETARIASRTLCRWPKRLSSFLVLSFDVTTCVELDRPGEGWGQNK